jgi:hypothetical protein
MLRTLFDAYSIVWPLSLLGSFSAFCVALGWIARGARARRV